MLIQAGIVSHKCNSFLHCEKGGGLQSQLGPVDDPVEQFFALHTQLQLQR